MFLFANWDESMCMAFEVSLLRGHEQIALCDQLLQSIEKRYEPTTLAADFAALEARRFDRAEQCAAYFVTVQARLEEDLFDALAALRDARQRHDVEECLHRIEKTPGVRKGHANTGHVSE